MSGVRKSEQTAGRQGTSRPQRSTNDARHQRQPQPRQAQYTRPSGTGRRETTARSPSVGRAVCPEAHHAPSSPVCDRGRSKSAPRHDREQHRPSRSKSGARTQDHHRLDHNQQQEPKSTQQKRQTPHVPPGASAVLSGKELCFSTAPDSPKMQWRGSTKEHNKRVFCECFGEIAAEQAREAARTIWDAHDPRNDGELMRLVKKTAMKLTVREGANLMYAANSARWRHGEELAGRRKPGSVDGSGPKLSKWPLYNIDLDYESDDSDDY